MMLILYLLIFAYVLIAMLMYRLFGKYTAINSLKLALCVCWPMTLCIMIFYWIFALWSIGLKGIMGDGDD